MDIHQRIDYWDKDGRQHTAYFDHNHEDTLYMIDSRGNKFKIKKADLKRHEIGRDENVNSNSQS